MLLTLAFFGTALIYASVGFAGGSTYSALLILAGIDYLALPSIALCCNLIVAAGGTFRAARRGLIDPRLVVPFALLSAPMAWLGGRLPIDQAAFALILGSALLASGLAMLIRMPDPPSSRRLTRGRAFWIGLPAGGILGLAAGSVGIGGGVFLAPLLHLTGLTDARRTAATTSVFILVNSVAGLLGQSMKRGTFLQSGILAEFLPRFVAVLVGGQIGSHMGFTILPPRALRAITAVLVLYVALRLLYAWLGMMGA